MSGIFVRNAVERDAGAIQAIYAPIVANTAISFEVEPPSAEEMQKRIAAISKTYPYLVAERDGQVIGYAHASEHQARAAYRWSANVSVYIAENARRMGAGKMLYAELFSQLGQSGFHAAFAGIALPNPGSIALHEAMGFSPVGIYKEVGFKFGRWHDAGWWQRLIEKPAD